MPPNTHHGSSNSRRHAVEDEEDKKRHGNSNESSRPSPQPQPSPSTSHRLLYNPHRIPIHLIMAGWNRISPMPRWMMERTLGFVVPVVQQHHHHHHNSSTVRRVLEQHQSEELDFEVLKQKYAKEIKANSEIQGMQKQIRAMKQQLQQQRQQREKLEKKQAAWREKEQKQLESSNAKLQAALEQWICSSNNNTNSSKNTRTKEYNKALARAGTGAKKPKSSGAAGMVHSLSKAAISTAMTPMTLAASAASTATGIDLSTPSTPPLTPEEKEVMNLESTILRTWHQTMICQNQCEIAESYSRQVTSALKRERAILDTQQAEVTVMQMVLDGTQRALQDLYPELVLRQEDLLERIWEHHQHVLYHQHYDGNGYHHHLNNPNNSPPPQKAPIRLIAKCPSTKSDGIASISDLGESILGADSMTDGSSEGDGGSFHNHVHQMYNSKAGSGGGPIRPPVFTTVEALQQHTLQHMAGVETF